ncbi:MAG: hypothetical protein MRERV_21c026 [Mycoplasmataceae bacterium RV_VA103A]|nr:MAG: hypothetical protein MRERV_21c026 [Mycoplasmataceae bacterium RV_VA103A]
MASGYSYGVHLRQEHWKGKKKWISCLWCQIFYHTHFSAPILLFWKLKYKHMSEITSWILIITAISVPVVIGALFNYFLNKKKVQAETEKIRLQNKITKEITYDQLKTESKQKDIKGKIDIFQRLTKLEEEIKNKENKTASDQKKLESLEMIKKEFKQSFEVEENPKLVETEKKLEAQKENKNKKKRKSEPK